MQKLAKSLATATIGASVLFLSACNQEGSLERTTGAPQTEMEKQSYAMGRSVALGLQQSGIEFERAPFNAGFYDVFDGVQLITDEEMRNIIIRVQQDAAAKQQAKFTQELVESLDKANEFLEENSKKEGVVTLDSGLQYKVITDAEGAKPAATDRVTVHYEGRLLDGQVFDSSLQRGEPASFVLNQVIPGWTEALQLMSPGAKWQIFIPPQLAYGDRAVGEIIKPNSALIFDVELLSIGEEQASVAEQNDEVAEQESVAE